MSKSEKDPPEKTEKHRIWELEEQLDDEQHAHRKTKFALREAQDKLEQMSNEMKNQRTMNSGDDKNLKEMYDNSSKTMIEDLRQEVSRLMKSKNETVKSLEMSKLENEDLRNRQIESNASFKSTILALDKKIGTVETENKSLKNSSKIREIQLTVHLERADKSERLLQTKTEEVERLNRILTNQSKEIGVLKKDIDDLRKENSHREQQLEKIRNEKTQSDEKNLKTTRRIESLEKINKDLRQEVLVLTNSKNEAVLLKEKTQLENEDLKNRQSYGNAPFKSIIIDLKTTIGALESVSIAENTSPEMDEVVPENLDETGFIDQNRSVYRSICRFWRVVQPLRNENQRLAELLMAVMKNIEGVMKKTGSDAEEREQLNETMQRLKRHWKSKSLWLDSFSLFEFIADACFHRLYVLKCVSNKKEALNELREVYKREKPRFDRASEYLKNNSSSSHWIHWEIRQKTGYMKVVEDALENFSKESSKT